MLMDKLGSKKRIMRIVRICLFTLLGLAVAEGTLLVFGERVEEIYYGGKSIAFAPVFNRDGTWFHSRLQIGYRPALQLAENCVTLCLLWYLYRFIAWMGTAMKVDERWLYGVELSIAGTLARLVNVLRRQLTLDYIYIGRLRSTFDLIDFYLGISLVLMLFWLLLCEVRYLKVRKRETAGMDFWRKTKWALVFTGHAARAAFLPAKSWGAIIAEHRYQY